MVYCDTGNWISTSYQNSATNSTDTWKWNEESSSATATATTYDTWYTWVNQYEESAIEKMLKKGREYKQKINRMVDAVNSYKIQRAKELAEEKALKLLKENLTKEQLERFEKDECIPVDTAKGNKYLIKKGRTGNVHMIDKDGNTIHQLCAHPRSYIPDFDTMLAQKFYLEYFEDEFLQIANRH